MANPIDFILRNGLQVTNNVVVGSYTMANAAPVNGMIVSGNVGIGTAIPTQKLQVVGNIQITNVAGALSGIYFPDGTYQATSAASYSTPPGGPTNSVQYNTGSGFGGSSNFVFHNSNSYVGIGTSEAKYIFHVVSTNSPAVFSTRNGSNYEIQVGNNSPVSSNVIVGYNPTNNYGYFTAAQNSAFPTVIVTQTGRVGIASTVPSATLTVGGNAAIGWSSGITVPNNSLTVAGNIGIGDSSPSAKLSILADSTQTAIYVKSDGQFLKFVDGSLNEKFVIGSTGTVTAGIWQGSAVTLNYGGTGLDNTGWVQGQLVYYNGAATSLDRLPIQPYGNVLITNGTGDAPIWGKLDVSVMVSGKLKIQNGGTNASAFSGNAVVITASNGLVMSSLTSNTNAAVVFDNFGGPKAITGGPFTYLTTDTGGNALSFNKVNVQLGVTGTLQVANGGTGTPTVPQYALLYGSGNTVSMSTLLTGVTSALVTGATGSPQWTSGTVANRVLRTDGTSITFSQVALATDVSGILPLANGGTNASLSASNGGMVYSTATAMAITNPNALTWDNVNGRLGINTSSPTGYLDVNGNVVIRNGANIVAGGLYVQSGVSNFVTSIIANDITSNTFIKTQYLNVTTAANVQGITSNTTVIVNGSTDATSTSTGALIVAGGAGIAKNLYVGNAATIGGNLYVSGNLIVNGNVSYINTNVAVIEDPAIAIGTGPNGAPLTTPDSYDRGLEYHYYSGGGDRYGFVGWQNATGQFVFISNATAGSTTGIYSGPLGDGAFGNIVIGSASNTPKPSTSTSTGALIIQGTGGIGLGGNIYVGGTIFGVANTAINASNITVTSVSTNATFYPSFFEATSGNLIARVNNSLTYNPGTGLLSLVGSLNVQNSGQFGNLSITNTTSSTSSTTGALVVAGGVGITGNLFTSASAAHGNLSITNTTTTTSSTTGALVVAGGIGAAGNIFTPSSVWAGNISVTNTTATTGSTTGALVVAGGIGAAGNIFTPNSVWAGNMSITTNIPTTSSTTGALVVAGGIGAAGNIFTPNSVWAGNISINTNIPTTSSTTGSLTVAGGVGITNGIVSGGNVGIGTTSTVGYTNAALAVFGNIQISNTATRQSGIRFPDGSILNSANISNIAVIDSSANNQDYYVTFVDSSTGSAVIRVDTDYTYNPFTNQIKNIKWAGSVINATVGGTGLTNIPDKAFIYGSGGVALNTLSLGTIDQILVSNGSDPVWGKLNLSNSSILNGQLPMSAGGTSSALTPASGALLYSTSGNVRLTPVNQLYFDNVNAYFGIGTSAPTQRLDVRGAIYTTGNVAITNTIASTSSTTGALTVAGGVGISGNLYANSSVWAGNMSVTNTTATVSSTTGALVVAGGIGVGGNIFTSGSVWAGNMSITSSTSSTNTGTGALVVAGGLGVGENINAAGTITVNKVISNTTVSGNAFILNGNVTAFGTTGSKILDSWSITAYRTAHYMVQITDNTNTQYHIVQITVMHDGSTVYKTEYNIMYSSNITDPNGLGTFDASIAAGTLSLTFTPSAATNKTVKLIRTAIEI